MSTYAPQSDPLVSPAGWLEAVRKNLTRLVPRRASLFGLIMVVALLAFELFNYGTTEFALRDLLGDLSFGVLRWSTVLALAFCGMDFAGIARLLTPERNRHEPVQTWYLLGAWLLASTMNATLTWWAVSLALLSHTGLGNEVVGRHALLTTVPAFVAVLVWLIRVLIIGTFTLGGDRLFAQPQGRTPLLLRPKAARSAHAPSASPLGRTSVMPRSAAANVQRPAHQQPIFNHPSARP